MRLLIFTALSFFSSISFSVESYTFPEDFQWCVATAGHQIEGDNIHSDWWEWEQKPGKIANGDRSGKAAYHMERLQEDVNIMKDLGVDTYRFSIEWSRIEPRKGEFDAKAVAHYKKEFQLLKNKGIRPMVTLHHFVQPYWFTDSGGWRREDSPELFLRFVRKIEQEFGGESDYWITFNEPNVLLFGAYGAGLMPPGETDFDIWAPMVNILKAHGKAYHYLHQRAKEKNHFIKVGMAHHIRPLVGSNFVLNKLVSIADFYLNWNIPLALKTGELKGYGKKTFFLFSIPWRQHIYLDEIKNTQDFLGINYYTREYIRLNFTKPYLHRDPMPGTFPQELNWGMDPKGFAYVLAKADGYFPNLPFFITESGLADSKDEWRGDYVAQHLRELHGFMTEYKHKVEGYCYWSLMDNFEWQEGFTPRFGLYEVNYQKKGERTARPSVSRVREIFKTNVVTFPGAENK
jgi:beta-glucosidase